MQSKDEKTVTEKLDAIIRLLEDLFILHATQAKLGRENIRAVLKITPNRISRISKGFRQ